MAADWRVCRHQVPRAQVRAGFPGGLSGAFPAAGFSAYLAGMRRAPILIAGPTGSGKSALALALAECLDGTIINADSQQVYAEWRILTARPTPAEEAAVPHLLYGHVRMAEPYSVGRWLAEVSAFLEDRGKRNTGRRAIITGGTGLYFRALTEGLAPIPAIPPAIRDAGEALLAEEGLAALVADLLARDPETSAAIDLSNPRRVLRAWEVLEATGIGLEEWKARTPPPLLPPDAAVRIALTPPREWLDPRLDRRFERMIAEGALAEVARIMALDVPPAAPGLRATGAPELAAHLAGEISLEEATARAKTETRRYAKRQLTWIRNQMAGWEKLDPSDPEILAKAMALVEGRGVDG